MVSLGQSNRRAEKGRDGGRGNLGKDRDWRQEETGSDGYR